jgi:hypothetical protein
MPQVYETFESLTQPVHQDYLDSYCPAYPDQDSVAMTDISLSVNGSYPTPLGWGAPQSNPDTTCGQYTVVQDAANKAQPTNGEIDFYMRTPITSVSLGQMYDGEEPCIWISGISGGAPPFIYTWSSSDDLLQEVDTTDNTQDTVGFYDYYSPTNVTVYVQATDVFGTNGSNSDYVTDYNCPDEPPHKGGAKVRTTAGGRKSR